MRQRKKALTSAGPLGFIPAEVKDLFLCLVRSWEVHGLAWDLNIHHIGNHYSLTGQ